MCLALIRFAVLNYHDVIQGNLNLLHTMDYRF